MLPFGETVLLWRLERRMSQVELARRADVSRPNLSAIERGKREVSLKTLRALAFALGIRPGVLVDGVGPRVSAGGASFSREGLERIADAVVSGNPARDEAERELAEIFRVVSRRRLAALKRPSGAPQRARRIMDRSWLKLSAGYPPQVIRSLAQRIQDREQVLGA